MTPIERAHFLGSYVRTASSQTARVRAVSAFEHMLAAAPTTDQAALEAVYISGQFAPAADLPSPSALGIDLGRPPLLYGAGWALSDRDVPRFPSGERRRTVARPIP